MPRDLETICLKCLQKDPRRRYSSAEALADDLERWLAGEPITSRPVGRWERTRMWARRRPAAAALITVCIIGSLTLLVGGFLYNRSLQQALSQLEARELTVRRHLYAYDLKAVQTAWDKGNMDRVHELLDAYRPKPGQADMRSFAWYHYWGLCREGVLTLRTAASQLVAYAPDGKTIATAGSTPHGAFEEGHGHICLWDAQTGQQRASRTGPQGNTRLLLFSPDSKTLVMANGKTLVLYDPQAFKELSALPQPGAITGLAFAKNHPEQLAVALSKAGADGAPPIGEVRLLNLRTGAARTVFTDPKNSPFHVVLQDFGSGATAGLIVDSPHAIALNADGTALAVSTSDRIVVLNPATGAERFRIASHIGRVTWSPDGTLLAVGALNGGDRDQVLLFDAMTGKERANLTTKGGTGYRWVGTQVAFAPDGQTLASARGAVVQLWDVAANKEKAVFQGPRNPISSLAFSPDGTRLAVAASYASARLGTELSAAATEAAADASEVRVWDVSAPSGPEIVSLPRSGPRKLAFTPDSRTLIVQQQSTDRVGVRGVREMPEGLEREFIVETKQRKGRRHDLDPAPDGPTARFGDTGRQPRRARHAATLPEDNQAVGRRVAERACDAQGLCRADPRRRVHA